MSRKKNRRKDVKKKKLVKYSLKKRFKADKTSKFCKKSQEFIRRNIFLLLSHHMYVLELFPLSVFLLKSFNRILFFVE